MSTTEVTAMKVYLDDARDAPEGWVRTYSVAETIELLQTGQVTVLSLDHDLGIESEVGSGYDVLDWIERQVVANGFQPPKMVVHSANPPARQRMEQAIRAIERVASGGR